MIIINLDAVLERQNMSSLELAQRVGITQANLSILKTGKARAIRLSTLDAICRELECQPGDILAFEEPDNAKFDRMYTQLLSQVWDGEEHVEPFGTGTFGDEE